MLRPYTLLALLTCPLAVLACTESTAPERLDLPEADVAGSYVVVRAARGAPGQVCFTPIDPAAGEILSIGLLTFDPVRAVVRQEEVRLGCSVRDTVRVDQERPYHVAGPLVVIDRPATPSGPVSDTGSVTGGTLVLRSALVDFVYERISGTDATYFYRTSDIGAWSVGWASFDQSSGTAWEVSTEPSHFTRNQRLYLFRPAGRPAPGTYQLGPSTTAPFYARLARDLPSGGVIFESTAGTVTIAESTPERVSATFTIDMLGGNGASTRVEGRFTARPTP